MNSCKSDFFGIIHPDVMVRLFFLLSPVFVSLFWAITLMGDKKVHNAPRLFLAKFMLLPALIFTAHFLYFANSRELYPYFECPQLLAGLLAFPMYHIYFRLLTVDEKFSFRVHHRYLIVPVAISLVYSFAVVMTPSDVFRDWLFRDITNPTSPKPAILDFLRKIIMITFIVQLFLSVVENHRLLIKYGNKAGQFYSDFRDSKNRHGKLLNYSILVMSTASLIAILLGRYWLMSKDVVIYVVWSIFSVSLYVMGYLGLKQKIINPSVDKINGEEMLITSMEISDIERKNLLDKINREITINKIFLNNKLTIMDLVKIIGTNRTYISSAINQQYNQNFCCFINSFRVEELKRVLLKEPGISSVELAECCGFGSVNSMKRAITTYTGMLYSDFRKQIYSENQPNQVSVETT